MAAVNADETHEALLAGLFDTGAPEEALAHVKSCSQCAMLQMSLEKGLDVVRAQVAEVAPAPQVLSSLMNKLKTVDRLGFFAPRVAELFDISVEAAQALLKRVNDPKAWEEGPGPGVWLLPVHAGKKCADMLTVLMRLDEGATFPHHEHSGPEQVLILEGGYTNDDGKEYWRGELHEMKPGTMHSFKTLPGLACICAARNALTP